MADAPGLIRRIDDTGVPLLIARLVLAWAFITMGWEKIQHPVDFLKLLREYQMLPEQPPHMLNLTVVVMPWLELICGSLLLGGIVRRAAALWVAVMLVAFTGAILLRTFDIYGQGGIAFCDIKFDCGCGAGEVIICNKVAANAGLLACAAVAIFSRSNRLTLASLKGAGRDGGPVVDASA